MRGKNNLKPPSLHPSFPSSWAHLYSWFGGLCWFTHQMRWKVVHRDWKWESNLYCVPNLCFNFYIMFALWFHYAAVSLCYKPHVVSHIFKEVNFCIEILNSCHVEYLQDELTLAGWWVPTKLLSHSTSSAVQGEKMIKNLWVEIKAKRKKIIRKKKKKRVTCRNKEKDFLLPSVGDIQSLPEKKGLNWQRVALEDRFLNI